MKILRSILIETKKFAQNEGSFDKRNSSGLLKDLCRCCYFLKGLFRMYFGLVRGLLRYTLVHGFFRGGLGLFGGGVAII